MNYFQPWLRQEKPIFSSWPKKTPEYSGVFSLYFRRLAGSNIGFCNPGKSKSSRGQPAKKSFCAASIPLQTGEY
jgi:hypothetical protein